MRIPHTICSNAKLTYDLHPEYQYPINRKLKSEDFRCWDQFNPLYLTELCIGTISKYWLEHDFPIELPLCSDTCMLLDILPTSLPLELAVSKIEEDAFWKRCYQDRWPGVPPRGKNFSEVPIFEPYRKRLSTDSSPLYSRRESSIEEMLRMSVSRKASKISSEASVRTLSVDVTATLGDRPWKQCYLEKYLEEALENLEPENYDPHKIKELSDLCGKHVKRMILKQLKAPNSDSGPSDYIPLNPILSGLPHLKELSICYKQTYVGERFCWHMLKTTLNDIKSLASGLEKCKLTILRVLNSDVDCKKILTWVKVLLKNDTLKVLDFSHCKIADFGILAIGKLLQVHPTLDTLIMKNNNIGPKGAEVLAFLLSDPNCKLTTLDLRLNEIGYAGGYLLSSVLMQKAQNLKRLFLASCGMNKRNVEWGRVVAFNKHLEELDLSNNRMGEDVGKEIAKGIKYNTILINFDIRMCNVSPETEFAVREKIFKNRMRRRMIHSEWTQLQLHKAFDFLEMTVDVKTSRDVNKEIEQLFIESNKEG